MDKTLNETRKALVTNWDLDSSEEELGWALLKRKLTEKIGEWLDSDINRLVNAMYRLDIREDKFRNAMSSGSQIEIAGRIAELVLEREKERAYWRAKYKEG